MFGDEDSPIGPCSGLLTTWRCYANRCQLPGCRHTADWTCAAHAIVVMESKGIEVRRSCCTCETSSRIPVLRSPALVCPTKSLLYRQRGCRARDVCRGEGIVQDDLTEAGLVEVDLLNVNHLDRQPSVCADVGLQVRAVVRDRPFCYIHLAASGVTAANCALED